MRQSLRMPRWDVRFDLQLSVGDGRMARAIIRAEELSRVIQGIYVPPQVREALDRLNIARAARGTTAIEGAVISEEEAERVLATTKPVLPPNRARDEAETRNAAAAAKFIAEVLEEEPSRAMSEGLVQRLNELLTQGVPYANHDPGRYRRHGVTVGDYAPPAADDVPHLMSDFIRWLNGPAMAWPPIARAVAAHFYLVTIHPFGDGNGRTSRSVESYLLFQAKINVFGFYSLANFYYRNHATYIQKLIQCREDGSLTPFVLFACEGLVEELDAVHTEVLEYLRSLAYRDFARRTLDDAPLVAKTRGRLLQLTDVLSERPIRIDLLRSGEDFASRAYGRTSMRTLERDIALLERLGLVLRDEGAIRANLGVMRG